MSRLKVFITGRIPQIGVDMLQRHFEVELYSQSETIARQLLLEKVRDADALLCILRDDVNRELIDAAANLKIISQYGVGYNNIDVEYATRKNIWVTNTPGVLTDATADLAWALLLAVTRRVVEGDRTMRRGGFKVFDPLFMLGGDIAGKTLGIIGAGRIGTAVAKRSRGWKMNILYVNRSVNRYLEEELGARKTDLETLLKTSDFISIHLPLNSQTRYFIGKKELELMKPAAYLVNTSRGPLVDEAALVEILQKKRIAGAALDVFENEPQMADGLAELDNVVLTPHIGSATFFARNKMAEIAASNIINWHLKQEPVFLVNPEVIH
jgi:glyoxylate reductase